MGAVEIAAALAASRRAVRLYPPVHPTHRQALRDLVREVNTAIDVRPLTLNLRDGRLYEGSEVITESGPFVRALAEAMESRRVESLTFHMGFGEADGTAISEVLSIRPSPELQVGEELEARGVSAVTVSELEDNTAKQSEARDQRREADRSLYRQALSGLTSITDALAGETPVDPAPATRAIAQLIERTAEDTPAVVALALMSGHGERWRFHAVSVMLYSLVLGHAVGLPDEQLLAVGLAALLHDVGSVVNGGDSDDVARDHPVKGAFALGALLDEDCSAMLVAYEHHMGVDGSGWPERDPEYAIHPCSRIVAIADRYDNLVKPAHGTALRPDEAAIQLMREADGGPLGPVLTRLFVKTIGVLPVGSFVRLSDFSIGVVQSPGTDQLRPLLRLLLAPDGSQIRPAREVDLGEDERQIIELVSARVLDMQVSDYL